MEPQVFFTSGMLFLCVFFVSVNLAPFNGENSMHFCSCCVWHRLENMARKISQSDANVFLFLFLFLFEGKQRDCEAFLDIFPHEIYVYLLSRFNFTCAQVWCSFSQKVQNDKHKIDFHFPVFVHEPLPRPEFIHKH